MEDTLQHQVGEQSSIRVLLPFKNGNTSKKNYAQKTHSRNWLRFSCPARYAINKRLYIFLFTFATDIFKFGGLSKVQPRTIWEDQKKEKDLQ